MRSLGEQPPQAPQAGTLFAGRALVGDVLPSNFRVEDSLQPLVDAWDEPDAVADIAFAAGLLGLIAGLFVVLRLSATHFPDTLFWRALPLLLVVPPTCFVGALFAPGGLLEGGPPAWARAARLGMSGVASYVAPVIVLSVAAALACLR